MNISVEKLPSRINLGRNGEKNIVQYTFDFTDWVEKYGNGDFIVRVQRHSENESYDADVTIDGNIATWDVSEKDTGVTGVGHLQLCYEGNDFVKKSQIITFSVLPSLVAPPEPTPEPTQEQNT